MKIHTCLHSSIHHKKCLAENLNAKKRGKKIMVFAALNIESWIHPGKLFGYWFDHPKQISKVPEHQKSQIST